MTSKNKTTQTNEARQSEKTLEPSNNDADAEVLEFLQSEVRGPNSADTIYALEQIFIEDTGCTRLEAHQQVVSAFNLDDELDPKSNQD